MVERRILTPEEKARIISELPLPSDEFNTPVYPAVQDPNSTVSPPASPYSKPAPSLESLKGVAPAVKVPQAALPSIDKAKAAVEDARQENTQLATPELESKIEQDLKASKEDKSQSKPIERDIAWLEKQYDSLNKEYKGKKDTSEWRAVAETVSNALTKLFAARAGMKAGVDMSSLQLDKTDFNKELESVQQDIERRQGQAKTLYDESAKGKAAAQAATDKKAAGDFEKEKFDYSKLQDAKEIKLERDKLNASIAHNSQDLAQRRIKEAAEVAKPQQKPISGELAKQNMLIDAGSKGVQDMKNAFRKGNWTFNLVGDNEFTEARTRFAEAMGRLNSGGAINKDEEARFQRMAPTPFDSREIQELKLLKMEEEFLARVKSINEAIGRPEGAGAAATVPTPQAAAGMDPRRSRLEQLRKMKENK